MLGFFKSWQGNRNFFLPFAFSFFQDLGNLSLLGVNISVLGYNITGGYLSNEMDVSFVYTFHSVCIYLAFLFKKLFFLPSLLTRSGYQLQNFNGWKASTWAQKPMNSGCLQFWVLSPSITDAIPLTLPHPTQYCSLSSVFPISCWWAWTVTHSNPSAKGHLAGLTE